MTPEERYQSFRNSADGRVVKVEAFYHEETRQYLVDWDDIMDVFPNISYVLNGDAAVARARDSRRKHIEPRCIRHYQDAVLEVMMSDVPLSGKEPTSTPGPVSRAATPDVSMVREAASFHNRTTSSASSHLTVDTLYTNTRAVSVNGPTYLMSPPYGNSSDSNGSKEHGRNNSDLGSHEFFLAAELSTPVSTPVFTTHSATSTRTGGQQQWTASTEGRMDSGRQATVLTSSESTSFSPPYQFNIPSPDSSSDGMNSLSLLTSPLQQTQYAAHGPKDLLSTTEPHTSFTTTSAAVVRIERPLSSTQPNQFMQRMQATAQSFEQFIQEGQLMQAKIVQQEAESIKKDMAQYYGSLQTEVSKNTTLQNQVKEMVATSEKMTKRILELQEAQLDTDKMMLLLQQQALDRLALIHSKATAILTQTYELHEFPIPRLFIILPKEDITRREKIGTIFVKRFRLYFLCECGEHTRPIDGPPSSLSHDIHLARHEGYDLDRPNEFFRKYGSYVLALLQMLKYGVVAAGMVVPPLNAMKIADELAVAEAGLKVFEKDFAPRVDSAIEYLQGLTAAQESVSKDLGSSSSTTTLVDPVSIGKLEGLEGADLRHLGSFLKTSDEGKVLGNLYRTVTPQGHVKWVCLDHYRESYGAAALQEFKEMVELSGGKYDQRTGRVTIRLASPILAKQFYTMLLSTRLVHELELSLDWNTSFEDLRILKGVMQQSNVFHLGLNLCGKTGPTSDFVYRNRRAEPIVQIMASGKMHTMSLKGTTSFLSQTKDPLKTATLHVRHLDLDENVASLDDFTKLEKLIRASPMLVRLRVMVGSIDQAFAQLRALVARHKTLSILVLQLQDGTAASVQFESGSGKIATIDLKVMEPSAIELMKMPMVTSVELLDKTSAVRCSKHIQTLIEQCPSLLTVKITHLPEGGLDGLRALQQAVDEYLPDSNVEEEVFDGRESSSESEGQVAVAPPSVERLKPESGFTRLGSAHRRSLLWELTLLVASFDEENMPEETPTDAMAVPDNISHTRRSAFTIRRQNGSLALVRLELEDNTSNSAVLHVGDFGASKAFMHTPTKTLTVIGRWSVDRLKEITKYSTTHLFNLRTLEIGYLYVELLDILSLAQALTTRCQALTRLHIRDMDDNIMRRFNLPLQDLDLTNDHITSKRHPSLMHLLQTATTLSRITLSVSSISETFGVVNSAAQLHKQLSYTQLDEGTSRFSVQFIIGTGTVESAALRVHEGELSHHLPLGTVTELNLGSPAELSRLKEIADSLFEHCPRLTTLKFDYICGGLLGVIDIITQATSSRTSRYQLVLAEVDQSATCRTERVFDMPLHTLDMASQYIDEKDLGVLKHLLRTNPALQELYLSVISIDVSQQIFDFIVQECRSITTVSMCLLSGLTGVFSLEAGTEDGALTVTQKIAQPELNETFFLPSAGLQRVDVIGTSISKSHAGEIAAFILRHYCGVRSIRFTDLPNEVRDVAIIIKESIQRGLLLRDLDKPESGTLDSDEVDPTNSVHKQVNLAVLSVRSDDTQNDLPPSATEGEYFFSIVRSRQDGTLEVVELDCTDPDGVTLRLNPVAFDKSDIAQLSHVTYLRVSIGQGSTLIEDMILTPVKAFSNLRQLELLLESSWHLSILLLLTSAENRHPTLEQVEIWHPDLTTQPIVYDLPFKTLNLTWCTISMANFSVVENIIVACPSLAQIALKVPLTATAFKLLSSIVKAHRSIAQLHLHDDEGTLLSVSFEPLTGEIIAISVEFVGTWKSLPQDDSPVLALMRLPVSILYLLGVIQEATINNPGLRCLLLKDMNVNICLDLDIPIKSIDLSERLMSQYDVESLQRLLLVCPLLAGLHMTVPSVNDLKAAYWSIGSISSSLKTLAECRLKIHNGAEALVRYSDEDGSVISVELRISDELDDELRTLPMIKRVTIQPEDTSVWHDSGFAAEKLRSIVRYYPVMTTLEIECDIGSPLPALLFLRFAVQVGLLPSSFRFRHWTTEDNHTLITHDLPLQKLDLGEFTVSHAVISDLGRFVHGCSHLREMAIGVINSATLDAAYDRFGRLIEGFGQLRVLKLRLNDGYAIKLWRNVSYENSVFSQTDPTPEAAALQVSGLVWPASFYRPITTKLTILPKSPTDDDDSDDSSRIHRIASKAKRDLLHLNHLVLTCPIDQFFQYLPGFAAPSQAIITRLDLQNFNKARTIISIRFWILPRAIVHLDNITDEDLLDNFGALFSEYFLRVEVVQREGKPPVIDVSMKGLDQDEGCILEEVLWDTRDVPACRVFSLLDKMSSRRRADVPRLFQFVWKTIQKATDARPHPREILDDNETATTLAKLLVRRATGFDLEYEAMESLIPFVITEIERENSAEWDKPFWALQSYTIGVLQGSTEREKILEFKNLIPRFVSCTIHDVYDCVDEYDSTSVSEELAYSSGLEDDDKSRDRRDV